MANYFVSLVNVDQLDYLNQGTGNMHSGTSSTAGDKIELRMDTTCTRFQVEKALCFFERWLKNGGNIGDGANVGIP